MQEDKRVARDATRFWTKVDRRGPDDCWNWKAGKSSTGYGHFTIKFENLRAHVFSYRLNIGPIPFGLIVLHNCDNPSCVNPAHLRCGSHRENNQDMVSRWRHRYGSNHHQSRLTEETVERLRHYRASHLTITYRELGELFGVSAATAHKVIAKKLWRHVA